MLKTQAVQFLKCEHILIESIETINFGHNNEIIDFNDRGLVEVKKEHMLINLIMKLGR